MDCFRHILLVCSIVSLGLGCQGSHREDNPPKPDSLEDVTEVNRFDEYGWGTPLYRAVSALDVDTVRYLLSIGADVNKGTEDGKTPLHVAAGSESERVFEIAEILVSHGANVNAKIESKELSEGTVNLAEGYTPLHEAVLRRAREIVDYLVSQGADLHARSKRGETPQDFLDEPNDVEPILLSGSDTYPLTLIRTDGLHVRLVLKSAGIDYDSLWSPSETDIDGLDRSPRKWLEDDARDVTDVHINPDYLLSHFDEYHREYVGFAARSKAVVAFRCGWHGTLMDEGTMR